MRVQRAISIAMALGMAMAASSGAQAAAVLVDDLREIFTIGTAADVSTSQSWNEGDFPGLHMPWFTGVIGEGLTDAAYGNGSAFQDSSASSTQFRGAGYTDGFAAIRFGNTGTADTFSQSVFDVGFDLLSAHNYQIEGSIYADNADVDYASVGILDLNTFMLIEEWATDTDGNIDFAAAGTLDPGFYAMVAFAETAISISDGWASGEAYWSFDATFTAVPVPAALWFLVSGIALLFGVAGGTRTRA